MARTVRQLRRDGRRHGGEGRRGVVTEDDERDYHQEYKDGVAMGYINEDGSPREPDSTASLDAKAEQEHPELLDEAHNGGPCDCPPFDLDAWMAEQAQAHRDEAHGGGECHCPPGEAPF